ncbi:cell division inhibitor SulA [Affinibrenneria salicis]|uniref:Cell division inhibitor SulA n=1 Tax=Affinibrenneria salicis TaxID=2590031 RepID=A0A5J5G398_9GAMM|nr:SOS-induced cell division inhibitor SulA [Affinibrenneria salicis]KAA9001395.1 cell division inhibitor SulA [Affinibrenneria salicis]
MRTQSFDSSYFRQPSRTGSTVEAPQPASATGGGIISEVVYSAGQPMVSQLLLPLLQQLGNQPRWLLWLAPQQKLSRHWLLQSGLPLDKVIQPHHINPVTTVDAMEKALQTGNYSAVLGWLPAELTEEEKIRLRHAARSGNSYGFIMRPQNESFSPDRPFSSLKIHPILYH